MRRYAKNNLKSDIKRKEKEKIIDIIKKQILNKKYK